jgi:hypothetical protein
MNFLSNFRPRLSIRLLHTLDIGRRCADPENISAACQLNPGPEAPSNSFLPWRQLMQG